MRDFPLPPLPDGLPVQADVRRFDEVVARARHRVRRATAAVGAVAATVAVVAVTTAPRSASLDAAPTAPSRPAATTAPHYDAPVVPTPTLATPSPTASAEPSPEPTPEQTATPSAEPTEDDPPTATPSPVASTYGEHTAYRRYVAGAAPAPCRSNQRREGPPRETPDHDWCMVHLGPTEVRIGERWTIVLRICRSGAEGVAAKEMAGTMNVAVRHEPRQTTWVQNVMPDGGMIEVQPSDCLEWTVTGWEKRIPLEPGTYVVDGSNHDWDACHYCWYYDPASKWDVTVTD